jgi:hypothetical protein
MGVDSHSSGLGVELRTVEVRFQGESSACARCWTETGLTHVNTATSGNWPRLDVYVGMWARRASTMIAMEGVDVEMRK